MHTTRLPVPLEARNAPPSPDLHASPAVRPAIALGPRVRSLLWTVALFLAGLPGATAADRPLNYDVLGAPIRFLPAPINDVALVGNHAYLGLETNLVQEIVWSTNATFRSRTFHVGHPARKLAFAQGVLAVGDRQRSVSLVDLAGVKPTQTVDLPSPASQMDFARDRLFVATVDGGLLEIRHATVLTVAAEVRELVAPDLAPGKTNVTSGFAADRSILVYGRNRRELANNAVEGATFMVRLDSSEPPAPDTWSKIPGALSPVFIANSFAYFAYDDPGDPFNYSLLAVDVSDPAHPVGVGFKNFGTREGATKAGPQILVVNQRTLLRADGTVWDCPNPDQRRVLGQAKLDPYLTYAMSSNTLVGFDQNQVQIQQFTNTPLTSSRVAFYGAKHAFALGVQGDFGYFPTGAAAFPDAMGPIAIYSGFSGNQPAPYAWMLQPLTNRPANAPTGDSSTNVLWTAQNSLSGLQIATYGVDEDGLLHLYGTLEESISAFSFEALRVTDTRVGFRGEFRSLEFRLQNGVPVLAASNPGTPELPAYGSPTAGIARRMNGLDLFRPSGITGIAVRPADTTNLLLVLPVRDAMLLEGNRALTRWPDGTLRLLALRETELYASPWPGVAIQGAVPADVNQGLPTVLRDDSVGRNVVRLTTGFFRVYENCPRTFGFQHVFATSYNYSNRGGAIIRSDRFEGAMMALIENDALLLRGLDSPDRGSLILRSDRIDGTPVRFLAVAPADPDQPRVRVAVQRNARHELLEVNLRLPSRPTFQTLLDLGPTNAPPPFQIRTPRTGAALLLWTNLLAVATAGGAPTGTLPTNPNPSWSMTVGPLSEPAVDFVEWGNDVVVAGSNRVARLRLPIPGSSTPLTAIEQFEIPEGVAGLYPCGQRTVLIDRSLGVRLLGPGTNGELEMSERLGQGEFVGALWDGDQILLLNRDLGLFSVASWGRPWFLFSRCTGLRLDDTSATLAVVGSAATRVALEAATALTGPWNVVAETQLDANGRGQFVVPRRADRFVVYRGRAVP